MWPQSVLAFFILPSFILALLILSFFGLSFFVLSFLVLAFLILTATLVLFCHDIFPIQQVGVVPYNPMEIYQCK